MVQLRSAGGAAAAGLGWALPWPAAEMVRRALFGPGGGNRDRAPARTGQRVRRLALGRGQRTRVAGRALQAGGLRSALARLCRSPPGSGVRVFCFSIWRVTKAAKSRNTEIKLV